MNQKVALQNVAWSDDGDARLAELSVNCGCGGSLRGARLELLQRCLRIAINLGTAVRTIRSIPHRQSRSDKE
jgi:hypothetical protein